MNNWREKRISPAWAAALCLLAAMTGAICCYAALSWRSQAIGTKLRAMDAIVASRYVGEMDTDLIADYAALGYMTGLGDRWSSYIPADEYEAYRLSGEGQTCGIGVSVAMDETRIRISDVYDESPAAAAGMEKGDLIVGAEGLTVAADGVDAVVAAIGGEEGTMVTVTVQKAANSETVDCEMTRAIVVQRMAEGRMLDGNVGYLRISNFHAGAAEQFLNALDTLTRQGAKALVIDVRRNGGGRVKEMSEALDPLLPEGTIITLRTKDGSETVYESDAQMIDLPIAVLIDAQSISAAEFFAAALSEYDRATLVGVHTTGKGRAQQTFALPDGSAVNLSTEAYFTPSGKSLADVGLAPDVEATLSEAQEREFYFLSPADDPQLQAAIAALT